jgi:hypothetical protein
MQMYFQMMIYRVNFKNTLGYALNTQNLLLLFSFAKETLKIFRATYAVADVHCKRCDQLASTAA